MADLKGGYSSGGSPKFHYDVSYSQTKRTDRNASYRVRLKVRLDNSYSKYGYGVSASVTINGSTVQKTIKSSGGMWSGSSWQGTWNFDITSSAGTGGGTLPATLKVWGTGGGSAPNLTTNGTVSLSTWNTAPTWTTNDGNLNNWKNNKIIPENTSSVTVNFPKATDREGDRIYYNVYRYVNDKSNARIATNVTGASVNDNIANLGQGTKIKYRFQANDGKLNSNDSWSYTYTKNKMTAADIKINQDINYDTSQISIGFSGYNNTNGDTTFNFKISSPDITIYNGTIQKDSTITIYKGGNKPSTPYILFEDLKNIFKKSTWQGTLTFNVETQNAYGSKSSKSIFIKVDLKTNPNASGNPNVGGQVNIAGGSYFVPSKKDITLNWSNGSDKLGGNVTYDILGCEKGGQWTTLSSNLNTNSATIKLDAVTKATDYSFKVITKTDYGYRSESGISTITLHYYNQPNIYIQNINRSASEFTCQVISNIDTSIPNVSIVTRQYQDKNGAWQNFAGSPSNLKISGLSEDTVISRAIKVADNSGQSEGNSLLNYTIQSYVPIFSIRRNGVGVNALPDGVNKLKVNGRAMAKTWVNQGYMTSYTGSSNGGKWTKIASLRVTGQYGDASATLDFLDSGSGMAQPVSGRIKCRLKQQNPLGQSSYLGLILENPTNCVAQDFSLVVATNTTSQVIAELWFRCTISWTSVYFYPSQILGEVYMFENQGFQSDKPSGQNILADYSFRETTNGINAISGINKNGYFGLGRPDGNDGDYIRTTQNGLIPYQAGGYGSLGTKDWNFNDIYGKYIYEDNVKLSDKYLQNTGGDVNGRLNLGDSNHRLTMGVGTTDAAIGNTKSGKWLQLRDDGELTYSGTKILTDIQDTPLWSGYHHLSSTEKISPSKPLHTCNNGWVLLWSNFTNGSKGNDWDICPCYIPKNTIFKNGHKYTFPLSSGELDSSFASKTVYVSDTQISGHDNNKKGRNFNMVIRCVLEY